MRTKSNRLEELFVRLTGDNRDGASGPASAPDSPKQPPAAA